MAQLIIESGEKVGSKYELGEIAIIGRLSTNAIPINDPMASREHSKITKEPDGFYVSDLESRNGTLVNGEKVNTRKLSEGDMVIVGRTTFRFTEQSLLSSESPVNDISKIPSTAEEPVPKTNGYPKDKNDRVKKSLSEEVVEIDKKPARPDNCSGGPEQKKVDVSAKDEAEKQKTSAWSQVMFILLVFIFFVGVLFVSKWLGEKTFNKMLESQQNHNTTDNTGKTTK